MAKKHMKICSVSPEIRGGGEMKYHFTDARMTTVTKQYISVQKDTKKLKLWSLLMLLQNISAGKKVWNSSKILKKIRL